MPGATLQLVAYGPQDLYLTGNPQITFFKIVYRRHTNFSMEDLVVKKITDPSFDGRETLLLPKSGDLFHNIAMIFKGNKVSQGKFLGNPTTAMINHVSLIIDGHEIDKQTGDWIEAWSELTKPNPNGTCTNITNINDNSIVHLQTASAYGMETSGSLTLEKIMHNGISYPPTKFQKISKCGGCFCSASYIRVSDGPEQIITGNKSESILGECILDIPFWFSKDPGLSIPLIALQNSTVQFEFKFNSIDTYFIGSGKGTCSHFKGETPPSNKTTSNIKSLFTNDGTSYNIEVDIMVLYIYLDTDERRRFAQVSHEYLIEQVQGIKNLGLNKPNIEISSFTHPVKELIWFGSPFDDNRGSYTSASLTTKTTPFGLRYQIGVDENIPGGKIDAATTGKGGDGIYTVGLIGPSTPSSLDACNWEIVLNDNRRTEPFDLHYYTRYLVNRYHTGYGSVSCPDSIAVYSFALRPEDHQPSGTCNFSKIDSVFLNRYANGQTPNSKLRPINVYAVNYNILRFMGGLCSLAYNI